jgi:hypothetical protein
MQFLKAFDNCAGGGGLEDVCGNSFYIEGIFKNIRK